MKLVALDLATTTGIAVGDVRANAPLLITERVGEPGSSHGARFSQMLHLTRLLISKHKPRVIVIEEPIAAGVVGKSDRVKLAMGYRASVAAMCAINGVRFIEAPVSKVRVHFIGVGNMPRDKAKAAVLGRCRLIGWDAKNDNESDAAAVWDWARATLFQHSTLPPNGLF